MLILRDGDGRVLLQQRPPDGLWGGLWSLPETGADEDVAEWCEARLGCRAGEVTALDPMRHGFTHFELEILPLQVELDEPRRVMAGDGWLWYNPRSPARVGLAAAVERLLARAADGEGSGARSRADQEGDR